MERLSVEATDLWSSSMRKESIVRFKRNTPIRRRTIAGLLASVSAVVLSLGLAQPSQAATPLGPYVIQNVDSKLCVQPNPANTGADIQLVQESCTNAAVHWLFWPLGGGNYHIQNTVTGNCMRARADRDFSPVETIDCTPISDETWSLQVAPSGGHLEILSHVSGGSRCLDVLDNALTPTTIDLFHCSSNSTTTNGAQVFFVQPNPAA
jgi:hypothetical protein